MARPTHRRVHRDHKDLRTERSVVAPLGTGGARRSAKQPGRHEVDAMKGTSASGNAPADTIERTREGRGFRLAASFDLLERLDARLRSEERRLGGPCVLPLVSLDQVPLEDWRAFWAQPRPVVQLVDGPLRGDWAVPILADETVLAHADLAEPFDGVAAFVAMATDLPKPQFDCDTVERIASALADALLAGEGLE